MLYHQLNGMVLPNCIWFCYILTANIFKFYHEVFLNLVLSNQKLQRHFLIIFTSVSFSSVFVMRLML